MKKYICPFFIMLFYFQSAWPFGSATILGMNNEHARITQAALSCTSSFEPENKPNPCFSPATMSNLGGISAGAFPAVESPDNLAMHLSGGPDWWHCDKGDYLADAGYPQTRDQATQKILDCRQWAQTLLGDGPSASYCPSQLGRTWLCTGVAARSRFMLDKNSNVDVSQPATFSLTSGCSFNGSSGRIKCEVLQQFGYALHAIQDFYSHSNYADLNETLPLSWQSPPGIGSTITPDLWDLKRVSNLSSLLPDPRLSSGCYPDAGCINQKRTAHQYLNKDKSDIDTATGVVTNPRTTRGQMVSGGITNAQRAVEMAIRQTRQSWIDLQQLIINKEGAVRGAKIICAITSDTPNNCGKSNLSARTISANKEVEEKDPKKLEPFKWMLDEFESQAGDLHASRLGYLTPRMAAHRSGRKTLGLTGGKQIQCGNKVIDPLDMLPGGQGKLTAYDLVVQGTNCSKAISFLRQYHDYYSTKGSAIKNSPLVQCMTITESDDGATTHARLVCKNKDESIGMSFHPTCGDHQGECGL